MRNVTRFQKILVSATGVCGGALLYYYFKPSNTKAYASWTTNYTPSESSRWDDNWDHRSPQYLIERSKKDINNNLIIEGGNGDKYKTTATRHIILIRHGQYNTEGRCDEERSLTELGRKQAAWTGERLKQLNIPYTELIKSTMTRAQETAKIIEESFPTLPVENCSLIEEGAPVPPEPATGHWKPEYYFFQDGARIEAAFRRYFHRASPNQEKNSYTIVVGHANVIRYFICRALQFPPEGWLRLSLNHASITWLSIAPNGRVILRTLGDSGHMPPNGVTCR